LQRSARFCYSSFIVCLAREPELGKSAPESAARKNSPRKTKLTNPSDGTFRKSPLKDLRAADRSCKSTASTTRRCNFGASTARRCADVTAILDDLASKNPEKLDWRRSIVDLMKLVGMDSSLAARKELAGELNYTGDTSDSAKINIWLHKEVIRKIADNGGKVRDELLT
jgi:hypothetical protein